MPTLTQTLPFIKGIKCKQMKGVHCEISLTTSTNSCYRVRKWKEIRIDSHLAYAAHRRRWLFALNRKSESGLKTPTQNTKTVHL